MKVTNKFGLPQTIVNILHRPTYSKGGAQISVTELIDSPRLVQLRRKHSDEIEQDASEMVWSLFGSAIHNMLEHGKDDNHIIEERLHTEIDGWHISGAIDLQTREEDGIVVADYKTTSVWSVINGKDSWEYQLNIYAWLVERVKQEKVSRIEIVAILRDWSAKDAETKDNYPQAPIVTIKIPLWDTEETEAYVRARINEHANAHMCNELGSELPLCNSQDMWERPTTFAVKKPKNTRATAVFEDMESATQKQQELGKDYVVEVRAGERVRCKKYCPVSQFCSQNKES